MRIVGGTWRGRALAGVGKGDAAAHLRPTTDRVRESIFNLLTHGAAAVDFDGLRVLDLFAGTGAMGFEALSRGAETAVFVENGRAGAALIAKNTELLGAGTRATLVRRDATRLGPITGDPFDLVFADPPYGKGLGDRALSAAVTGGWLTPGAIAVIEDSTAIAAPEGFEALDSRRYGQTWVTVLRFAGG